MLTAIGGHAVLAGGHAVARHGLAAHGAGDIVAAIGLRTPHDRGGHASAIGAIGVTNAARTGHVVLIGAHVVHAILLNGNHAERVVHAILRGEIVEPIKLVQITLLAHGSLLLLVLLDMRLRMRQVAHTSRVSTANGALLEVTLQDVASREGVAAENTHVRAVTSV